MSNQQSSKGDNTTTINQNSADEKIVKKPPKPEDKPFKNFINED